MTAARVALALASALALLACSGRPPVAAPLADAPDDAIDWQAPHGRDDPRAGRILDVARSEWIDETALLDALEAADFVLLGERHDHPDHHALQARIVTALVARGRRPAVAFEMLDADDAPALASVEAEEGDASARADSLRRAVAWDESGWPAWALYAPIFETALAAELPIIAANLARAERSALRRGGADALPRDRRRELGLEEPSDPQEFRVLSDQIREAHCGHAPEDALPRMVDTQRAWNAQLARMLVLARAGSPPSDGGGGGGSAVLIAGNEHVRSDRGVPIWLERIAPDARVIGLALLEFDPREPDLPGSIEIAFDYVWLTPRLDLEDPCEKYRNQLEKLR